jgi:hypothetical protein
MYLIDLTFRDMVDGSKRRKEKDPDYEVDLRDDADAKVP